MAAKAGRSVLRSASSLRTASSKISGSARPAFGLPKPRPASAPTAARILRSPVEMSFCVDSLLPLHSATASATMTSMLSVTGGFSGWLPLLRSISRTTDAFAVLQTVARLNQASLPLGTLVVDHQSTELEETVENPISSEVDHLINGNVKSETALAREEEGIDVDNDNNKHKEKIIESGGFSALATLLSPDLVFTTILIWIVFFGNAFSYYGLVLLTSELHMDLTGCSPTAVHKSPPQNSNLYKSVFLTSCAEFPGLLLAALLVDRIGRKMTMASMFFSSFIFLMPLLFQQSWLFTVILLFGARACISGSFTVIYIYTPEVYPTSVRSTGVGVASSVGRLGGILCPLVAIGLLHSCHKTISILVFDFVMFAAGVASLLFPLETKGRQLIDVPAI